MKSESESDISSEIRYLLRKESNCLCADCFDSCALFVDVDNCVFLCKSCSDIHKQLGFHIKNPLNDTFTFDEIQNLKKTDNETFNKKMMSLYQHDSPPIPFGASDPERFSFIEDKYIEKKWFSPIPNENNQSFYNRKHFDIVEEENDKTDDEQFLDSESETSEITSPNEPNFFGLHQKQNLIMSVVQCVDEDEFCDEYSSDKEQQDKNISHEEENYELDKPQKILLKDENDQTFDDHADNYNDDRGGIFDFTYGSYIPPRFEIQNQQFDGSLISPQDQNSISHDQEFAPSQQRLLGSLLISPQDQTNISHNPEFEPSQPQLRIQQQQFDGSFISPQDRTNIPHNTEFAPSQRLLGSLLISPQDRTNIPHNPESAPSQQRLLGSLLISPQDRTNIPHNPESAPSQRLLGSLLISPQDQTNISHNQESAPSQQRLLGSLLISPQDQTNISHNPESEPSQPQLRIQQQLGGSLISPQDQTNISEEILFLPNRCFMQSDNSFSDQKYESENQPDHFIINDDAVENDDFSDDENKSGEILANNQNGDSTSKEPNNSIIASNLSSIQNEDQVTIKNQIINAEDENNDNNAILNSNESKNEFMKNNKKESFHQENAEVNKKKFTIDIICVLMAILLFAFRFFIH